MAFGRIIKPHVLGRAADGQPALLAAAALARAAPVERALLAGDDTTGVCVMAVEEGLDTGGVYARVEVPIAPRRDRRRPAAANWSTSERGCSIDTLGARARRARAAGRRADVRRQDHARRTAHRLDRACRSDRPADPRRRRLDDLPRLTVQDSRALELVDGDRIVPTVVQPEGQAARWRTIDLAQRSAPARASGSNDRRTARQVALRRAAPDRDARRVRQPGARRRRSTVPASMTAIGASSPSWCTAPPACGGPATLVVDRFVSAAARRRHADVAAARRVPTRVRRRAGPRGGVRDGGLAPKRTAVSSTRCSARCRPPPMIWPSDGDPPELPRLDRSTRSIDRTRRRRCAAGDGTDERAATGHRTRATATCRTSRRSGWRPRSAASPANWCSTCAPRPAARRRRSAAAGARVVAADRGRAGSAWS